MNIEKEGFILDTRGLKKVCTFTSLFKHSSGRIFASFRLGSRKDSDDGDGVIAEFVDLKQWKIVFSGFKKEFSGKKGEIKVVELFERPDRGISALLSWFDYSDSKKLYDASTDTILPSKILLVDSPDMGKTWRNYRFIDTRDLPGPALTGPVLKTPSGYLAFFETYGPEPGQKKSSHAARVLISRDGMDFNEIKMVAMDPLQRFYYWDQRNAFDAFSGRIISMFWTYNREQEKDTDIYISNGDLEKLVWTTPVSTSIRGQIAALIVFSKDIILCFYVHRHQPGSMRLVLSEDGGRTWKIDKELIVYQNPSNQEKFRSTSYAEYWEEMNIWNFGHPSGILLDNRHILLAYYAGENALSLSARYAIVSL